MTEQSISKFKARFEEYSSVWKSIEVRALFAKKGQEWVALKIMAYLRDNGLQEVPKITFDDLNLRAVVEYKSIDAIWDLVEQMRSGQVSIGGTKGTIGQGTPNESSFGFLVDQSRSGRSPEPLFPYFTLYLSLGPVNQYVDENEINKTLYSYGYRGGLQEFSVAKIGDPVGGSYVTYFGIVAPIYLLVDAEYEPGYLKTIVYCEENIEPGDITLRYELYGKTQAESILQDEIIFSPQNRNQKWDKAFLEGKIAIPPEVLSGRLTLFYRQIKPPADSLNVFIHGVKASILDILGCMGKIQEGGARFETLLDRLTQWLGVQQKAIDAERFEMAVWTLLTLSGLRALNLGKVFGKGFDLPGVDILAFHESTKRAILVSCTIENKLSGKIEPLLQQLNAVKNRMEGWTVNAAILAPIERKDITLGSFSDAIASGIAILLKPEITQILGLVGGVSEDTSTRIIEILSNHGPAPYLDSNSIQAYRQWQQDFGNREVI